MEKFIHVDRCDSTQELLKEQLTQTGVSDLTVSCEHQMNGRGRGVNTWQDSAGTICFSMSIQPHVVPTFTALEISTLIADFFLSRGRIVHLKWPNDLMNADEKKCGGVLVQTSGPYYLAGIGLNLFSSSAEFGGIYETSFEIEKKAWVQEINDYIRANRYVSTYELKIKWAGYCYHLNREVRIFDAQEETMGSFIGLGEHGEALLQNASGVHKLYNGSLRLI